MTADETADVTDVDEAENGHRRSRRRGHRKRRRGRRNGNEVGVAVARWHRASVGAGDVRARLGAILLAVALVASAGVAAWLYFKQYRPDQEIERGRVRRRAGRGEERHGRAAVVLTGEPGQGLRERRSRNLTGDFLSYYTQFTEQIVTPAAKQKSVKTSATVVRAAVSEMHPDSAVVLVFINQITTSKENPDGAFAASAVKVGLKKISDAWLISSFDPV